MQSISEELYELMNNWMPTVWERIIETAGSRNVTEWAKKEECWSEIQLLDLSIPDILEEQLREGDPLPTVGSAARRGKADKLTTIDRQNINKVLQHDKEFWWRLGIWGQETGNLKEIQISIILTIASYAAGDWEKIPSAKQSKHCVAALDISKQERFSPTEEMLEN